MFNWRRVFALFVTCLVVGLVAQSFEPVWVMVGLAVLLPLVMETLLSRFNATKPAAGGMKTRFVVGFVVTLVSMMTGYSFFSAYVVLVFLIPVLAYYLIMEFLWVAGAKIISLIRNEDIGPAPVRQPVNSPGQGSAPRTLPRRAM